MQQDVPFIAAWPCKTSLLYWPLRNPDMVFNQFRRFTAPLKGTGLFLGKGGWKSEIKARSKRDQSEIKHYPKWTRYWPRCERGSTLQHLPTKASHCACHDNFHSTGLAQTLCHQCVTMCVCVCLRRVVWVQFVRTSQQLNAPFCSQFLHLCMYHQVCMCVRVCVFGQVVWFEFVRTSQQLNAAFCNQFLHLCMYHQVCMCVCVSSARLCDLSLSELVSN